MQNLNHSLQLILVWDLKLHYDLALTISSLAAGYVELSFGEHNQQLLYLVTSSAGKLCLI